MLDFDHMHEWHTSFLRVMKPLPKGTKIPEQMQPGDDMYLKFLQVGSNVKIVVCRARYQGMRLVCPLY